MGRIRTRGVSRRELFGSLLAMVFLVNLARLIFAPIIQPAAAEFEVTAAALGIVASAAWMGSAAPRLPTGYLLTRVPRHWVVTGTGSLLVATSLYTGLSQSVTQLTIGAFLMGMSSGMYFIAANPLVSELFPERVGTAIGIHGMSSELAAVVAPIIISIVLLVGNWRLSFVIIAITAAVVTIGLVVATRRSELPEAGSQDRSLLLAGKAQWPLILTGVAIIGSIGFLWNGFFNLYGDYLDLVKGIDPGTGRIMLSTMFAAGMPAFLVSGRLADRFSNVPLFIAIGTAFVLCVLTLTLVEGLLAIALVSVAIGVSMFSLIPIVDRYLLATLPDHHRGSAYALYSSSMMFVQALGSGVIGMMVVRGIDYSRAFQIVCLGVALVLGVLFVLYLVGRLPAGRAPNLDP